MKFTSEDLMKAMGLSVGDKLAIDNDIYIVDEDGILHSDIKMGYYDGGYLSEIVDVEDYEILPRPKRVGDLKCLEYECAKCPLRTIRCDKNDDTGNSLYYILDNVLIGADFDQEIHDLLKARLDKEVKE